MSGGQVYDPTSSAATRYGSGRTAFASNLHSDRHDLATSGRGTRCVSYTADQLA